MPENMCQAVKTTPQNSRLGGAALISENFPWPTDQCERPLIHLAQLNLAELPERTNFPNSGLLQFFIGDDSVFGLDTSANQKSKGSVVRLMPEQEYANAKLAYHHAEIATPIRNGYFEVTGKLYEQLPSVNDEQFILAAEKAGISEAEIWNSMTHEARHIYAGGWPLFIQDDPRNDASLELLLQIDNEDIPDSKVKISWGDAGVGHFFISPRDLERKDFSHVFYSWQCF